MGGELLPVKVADKYNLGVKLGSGSFGVIHLGTHGCVTLASTCSSSNNEERQALLHLALRRRPLSHASRK